MNIPMCANCRFWQMTNKKEKEGPCRKGPPVPLYVGEDKVRCFWPWTKAHDWCGSHEEIEDDLAEDREVPSPEAGA